MTFTPALWHLPLKKNNKNIISVGSRGLDMKQNQRASHVFGDAGPEACPSFLPSNPLTRSSCCPQKSDARESGRKGRLGRGERHLSQGHLRSISPEIGLLGKRSCFFPRGQRTFLFDGCDLALLLFGGGPKHEPKSHLGK